MEKRWLVLLTILSVLIFVVAGCAPAAAPPVEKPPVEKPPVEKPPVEKPPVEKSPVEKIIWKNAVYQLPASTAGHEMMWFWDEMEKRTAGRMKCNHFWSSSLSPAREQPDGLKAGVFEVTGICPAYYPSKTPLYNMGYLPCLFPFTKDTPEEWLMYFIIMDEWLDTPLVKMEFAQWDAMPICEHYPTFYTIMGNVSIASLEDLEGKKIRAIGGTADLLTKLGAAVVYTTSTEMYDALSKGIVEAACLSWSVFYPYKTHQVSKYWTPNINLGQMPFSSAVSINAYEALPDDIKEIYQELREEYTGYRIDYWTAEKPKYVEAFKEAGLEFVEFSAEDNIKLRELAREVWKENVDKLEGQGIPGKEAYNSLQDIIAKHVPSFEPSYL